MTMNNNKFKIVEFLPLQKVEVVSSVKAYKPGSVGYVTYVHSATGFTKSVDVIFMKYGQKGKARATRATVHHSAIDLSVFTEDTVKIVRKIREKYPNYEETALLTPVIRETKNLMEMPSCEFTCYIAAFSTYIAYLSSLDNLKQFNRPFYPHQFGIAAVFDIVGQLANIDPLTLHALVLTASAMGEVDGRNLFKEVMTFYDTVEHRKPCMESLFKSLAAHKKAIEIYHSKILSMRAITDGVIRNILRAQREDRKQKKEAQKKSDKK